MHVYAWLFAGTNIDLTGCPYGKVGRTDKHKYIFRYTFTALGLLCLFLRDRNRDRCFFTQVSFEEMTYLAQCVEVGHHSTCWGPLVFTAGAVGSNVGCLVILLLQNATSVQYLKIFAQKQDLMYRHWGKRKSDNPLQWNWCELDKKVPKLSPASRCDLFFFYHIFLT